MWLALRPALLVAYGTNMAALFAALMLLAQGRRDVLLESALVGTMAGIMLTVLALWGIRYPQPGEVVQAAAPLEDTQPVRILPGLYQDLLPLPVIPLPEWPDIPRWKLHRGLQTALANNRVSARVMRSVGYTDAETRILRDWLFSQGWGMPYQGGAAKLTPAGEERLRTLLPYSRQYRQP